ncbi:unnamed protein product [Ostreobium quekettii]|uniref:Uncharacterized protein n=1 Tax=Ostreobium quekettii TaxID=121088 RepID=A0A8S1JEM9_9CHLO|nr:unnamed protein product [Ostreobium quekettii]|eukprot:evm.model.scf_527.2 EVM.evm.TU.scf_527.2   scf_527:18285-19249(-)
MAKTSAAVCVLFMVLMAFAVQESEAIIIKSILLYKLYKKLTAKKAAVVPVAKAIPAPVPPPPVFPVSKPVFARATAGTKPEGYEAPSNYGDGRRL